MSALSSSESTWKSKNSAIAVWLKIPAPLSILLPSALTMSYKMHHATSEYIMLSKWLDESTTNKLPGYTTHYAGCGGTVINKLNQVLLVKERNNNTENRWSFPGGRADINETLEEAALREVYEELGLRCEVIDLHLMRESKRSIFGKADIFFNFLMRPIDPKQPVKACTEELQAYQWLDIAAIPEFLKLDTFSIYHVQRRIIEKLHKEHLAGVFTNPKITKDFTTTRERHDNYPGQGNVYTIYEPKITKH